MEFEGRKDGALTAVQIADNGGALVSNTAGQYTDAARNGRLFSVANSAAVATTAAAATTWTGLGVANPTGSGKLLILLQFGWALSVVGPDEGIIGLMAATDSDFTAAITVRCAKYAAGASVAYADDGATIVSPVLERVVSTYGTGAISTWHGAGPQVYNIDGSIILPPGRAICTYTTTATTAAFQFSYLWEEVDA